MNFDSFCYMLSTEFMNFLQSLIKMGYGRSPQSQLNPYEYYNAATSDEKDLFSLCFLTWIFSFYCAIVLNLLVSNLNMAWHEKNKINQSIFLIPFMESFSALQMRYSHFFDTAVPRFLVKYISRFCKRPKVFTSKIYHSV